ncbi:RVT_3 domain-containing protein [Cephalotus follicularis]|uniref:RVT_3 domain-containing protein n=1 Tax=Cephalotus follicularis TaxID=3775 RepID=A0A1Q3D8X9_CEPFO|nr:RVT_3 domain-containing protein [Cephalotus follicularis]
MPEACILEEGENAWELWFDGSSTATEGGAGIILQSSDNVSNQLAYKLKFFCYNNEVKYEELIPRMISAMEKGTKSVVIKGDSKLIIKKMASDYSIKEPALAEYRSIAQDLSKEFSKITLKHVPRA